MNPDELIRLAEKKKKTTYFDSIFNFFDKEYLMNKYQEIGNLYENAGNLYRSNHRINEAGESYKSAGSYYMKATNTFDAIRSLNSAVNCFLQIDNYTVICCYYEIIRIYTIDYNFDRVAEYSNLLAEMYEKENLIDRAIEFHLKTIETCETLPNRVSLKNKSLLKLAELYIKRNEYNRAGDIYEQYADSILNNRLLQYSAKEYYFNAGLCRMHNGDLVALRRFLNKCIQECPPFQNTIQYEFLLKLLGCFETLTIEYVGPIITEYTNLYHLEEWKMNVLTKITNNYNIDLL